MDLEALRNNGRAAIISIQIPKAPVTLARTPIFTRYARIAMTSGMRRHCFIFK